MNRRFKDIHRKAECRVLRLLPVRAIRDRPTNGTEFREFRPGARPKVGIFDSGVGGLGIAAALQRLDPDVKLRYIADSAHFPYGDKASEYVRRRVIACGVQLLEEGCDLIIVACNTACSEGLDELRSKVGGRVPVIGVEPPLKPAVALSNSKRIAVLATRRTVEGPRLARLEKMYASEAIVFRVAMTGLADLVEMGEVSGPRIQQELQNALHGPLSGGVDVVVLGCTHYGFIENELQGILPPHVRILGPEEPVARHTLKRLVDIGQSQTIPYSSVGNLRGADESKGIVLGATGCQRTFKENVRRLVDRGALVLDIMAYDTYDLH